MKLEKILIFQYQYVRKQYLGWNLEFHHIRKILVKMLQLIKQNYLFLRSKVEPALERYSGKSDKLKYLQKLRNKVSELPIIRIEIASEDDAYEIFETTNARGIDLSIADLLNISIIAQKATGFQGLGKTLNPKLLSLGFRVFPLNTQSSTPRFGFRKS